MIDNRVQSKSDLPRRRGSGSDEVDDEGVETRGKAESRKKKAEIAKSKIARYEYQSTPSATRSVARLSSKRDNYIALLSTHQTFVKFSLAGEGVAATKSMTREWKMRVQRTEKIYLL